MPIADCWDFDYANEVIQHVDGVLSYDGGSGTQPAVGQYIYGVTSGAQGKVIARTGTVVSGTLDLTLVEGLFEDNEQIDIMSELDFDSITNGGFAVGDTIAGNSSGSTIDVLAIEYNSDGLGGGTIYGSNMSAAFTNLEQLDISGGTADVANAVGTGTDNDTLLTAAVNGTLAVPGTANTNDSCIIHYDAGTQLIPEQAIVEGVTSGATGLVEQQYGAGDGTVGSLRLVDSDFGAADFQDNETLRVQQVVNYDAQVAGQVFSVGNVVVGATSGATGRVIAVIDDGDSTGRLILADESGTWDAVTPDDIQVGGVKVAEVENTTFTLNCATVNTPEGTRTEQRPKSVGGSVAQGGIYSRTESLNVVRKFNSLYTLSQDTFDELAQMDDDEALDAAFKGFAYSLVFGWRFAENTAVSATRFLRKGALIDSTGAEVWANPQSQGAQNKITSTAFLEATAQTFKQPQLYIEQNGVKVESWWLEGQIDVLLKVRTRQDPRFINAATPTLGQLIPGGDPSQNGFYTVFNREYYTSTYDATEVDGSAGVVNSVALGTLDDTSNNDQGTHSASYTVGSAATLLVGEEIRTLPTSGNGAKVGVVVAQTGDAGATGTVEYVLKSGTNFVNTDVAVGTVSGKSITFAAPSGVVAGFGTDIRFNVVEIACDSTSSTIAGTFIPGEPVTQAVTGATGRVVLANVDTDILYLEVISGTFSGLNVITGTASAATWTPTGTPTYASTTSFNADLNNGEGAQPYGGSVSADIAGTGAETIKNVYQYSKYLASAEQAALSIAGPGTTGDDDASTLGQLYRRLKNAYTEVKPGNPFGTYTGSMAFAQGWFLDTDYIAAADIRSFSVIDDNGISRSPPNLQSLIISGVASGWRVAAYRTATGGSTVIQRTEFQVGAVGGGDNQSGDSTILLAAQDRTVSPLPADVPDTGVLRILDPNDTGNYLRFPYTSVDRTNNRFTISGTIGAVTSGVDLTAADNAHVVLIEETAAASSVSNTIQYVADINIVYKARLKGFKPFRSTGTFGTNGADLGVVQTADTIVDLP